MPDVVVIHTVAEPGTDLADEKASLDAYLRGVNGVNPVLLKEEQPRLGVGEVLAVLQIVSTTIDLVQKLRDYLQQRRGKVTDIQIEIDGRRVSVAELTDDQRSRLAATLNRPVGS